MSKNERLIHLARWIKSLPTHVDNQPEGMVKLVRHLLADMDELQSAMAAHQAKPGEEER